MKSNINVINNAGKDVVVTVNNNDGSIQIIIDLAGNKVELSSLKAGQFFKIDEVEYIVCEQFTDGITAVIRKDELDITMKFGKNNNFNGSNWDKYLNGKYLSELSKDFELDGIIEHEVDLLSMDGYDDYGVVQRKVAPMTFDQFRKYSKYIGNVGITTVLATPCQTPKRDDPTCVLGVFSDGNVNGGLCSDSEAVRPYFSLKSDIFVSLKENDE